MKYVFVAIDRSYLNTMQVFNLHATMRQEFLRKQGDLFNLCQGIFGLIILHFGSSCFYGNNELSFKGNQQGLN